MEAIGIICLEEVEYDFTRLIGLIQGVTHEC